MFTTSLQLWDSCGYASCCTTSGQAKAQCHLSHRPNPCPLSASANAPASPHPSRASPNVLTALRVKAMPPIPSRFLRDDLNPGLPPTDARVSTPPISALAVITTLGLEPARQWPSQWRPMAAVAVYVLRRLLFGAPWHRLSRQAGGGGADGPCVGLSRIGKTPIRRLLSQEAIRPLYTTFEHFLCVVCRLAHSTPDVWPQTPPCFLSWGVSCGGAAPSTHQTPGLLTSRLPATRLPLAPVVPQQTVGFLPCPAARDSLQLRSCRSIRRTMPVMSA